jgi:hypothetical protein
MTIFFLKKIYTEKKFIAIIFTLPSFYEKISLNSERVAHSKRVHNR